MCPECKAKLENNPDIKALFGLMKSSDQAKLGSTPMDDDALIAAIEQVLANENGKA